MNIIELFILAVGLSMDAFAVSVCKGLSLGKIKLKHIVSAGLWFGGFQAIMPLIGYFFGNFFADIVTRYAHIVSFILLVLLGVNMIKESLQSEEVNDKMNFRTMLLLSISTSIDALAVGVTFAFLKVKIVSAILFIGLVTFIISGLGIKIGSLFGEKYRNRAEITGGIILIVIGIKILLGGSIK